MQDLYPIIQKICLHFNTLPESIAKKKFGKLPEYTYQEILYRILDNTQESVDYSFKEMSRTTLTTLLKKIFPGKENSKQYWFTYLLSCIDMKRCNKCGIIKDMQDFYKNNRNVLSDYCIFCESNKHKEYYLDNKDKVNMRNKLYNTNNKHMIILQRKNYYETHRAESKARTIKRNINLQQATPAWANFEKMNKIYNARELGEHIDHIIPLQGELVCGLHWEHNLQYLSAKENIAKSNKFNLDTYVHELPYI